MECTVIERRRKGFRGMLDLEWRDSNSSWASSLLEAEGKRAEPKRSQAEPAEYQPAEVLVMAMGRRKLPQEASTQVPGVQWKKGSEEMRAS